MKTIIIIPARMASVRFPNKPMALINGKPMIQRVWQKAKESNEIYLHEQASISGSSSCFN